MLNIIFCGGRAWNDRQQIETVMQHIYDNIGMFKVIEGGANGADFISKYTAIDKMLPTQQFKANWAEQGKAAGPIRNKRMLDEGEAQAVVAFHNNLHLSKGTANMVNQALNRQLPVWSSDMGWEKLAEFIIKLKIIQRGGIPTK